MKAVFADSFYFLALLNERDAAHQRAVAASRTPGLVLVTTEFVQDLLHRTGGGRCGEGEPGAWIA